MKKRLFAALAALLALTSLTACSESGISSGVSENEPAESGLVEKKQMNFSPIEVTNDNVLNSIRLFDMMSEGEEQSMFSPLSLNMVLGMLQSGAEGDTKAALDSYLGTDDYAQFAESYMRFVSENYNSQGNASKKYKNAFEIANGFWASKDRPFNEAYKESVTDKFGAEIKNIDFTKRSKAVKEINGWVNDKTHKLIPSIITENSIGDDTAAVLVNTVYFESGWWDEWDFDEDNKQPFTLLDGSTKDVPLMRNEGKIYFENDKATAFSCDYRNNIRFIGILPKETGDFTVESLDIPSLLESESGDYDVIMKMPKLEFESEFPLNDALKAAGLENIFEPDKADFSGMQGSEDESFYVSEVLQKTKLEHDDKGTKAAAATTVIMNDAAMAMPEEREIKEVVLDCPFAFLIYDEEQDQIVFLGKVTNP